MALIEVDHLRKEFVYYEKAQGLKGSVKNLFHREKLLKQAVNDISFSVEEGEIVGFLGPNGAGKTTTLKMLSGILYPTSGDASVNGYRPWERKMDFKKSFSLVSGQKSQLWPDLPAIDTFELNRNIYEIDTIRYQQFLDEIVDLLKVRELLNVQVRRLSLGERMKMELIAALLHQPKILFLDEPTIGLDLTSQENIRTFLREYNRKYRTTILITSHYMKDIEDLASRAVVINHGNIVFDGKLQQVAELFERRKVIRLTPSDKQPLDIPFLQSLGEVRQTADSSIILLVDQEKTNLCVKSLIEQYPSVELGIETIPLEEGVKLLYEQS